MTVSLTTGRAVGVLAVPAAPSEHMGKMLTEITARSELRDGISKPQLPGIGGLAFQSPRRQPPKESDDVQQTRWICVPGCCSPPRARSRVRTRPVLPRTGRTRLSHRRG